MSRPRRTRLYNTAYNIGESYYKPALDQLDRKYSGRPLYEEPAPRIRFADPFPEEGLGSARKRAERAITEETFFDSKGLKTSRGAPLAMDNDIDEEIQSTLSRIRANKQKLTFNDDSEFDTTKSSLLRKSRFDYGDKLENGKDESLGLSRRVLKVTSRTEDVEPSSLTKWSKLTDVEESNSASSLRAKATKTRLAELDSDMVERSERQAARERRLGNIKKLLADSEIDI